MDNSTLFDLLPEYALGTLSGEEREQVEALLERSEAARAELRTYEAMLASYATLVPAHRAPSRLTDDFRRRLAASANIPAAPVPSKPAIKRLPVNRTGWLLALAALVIIAIAITLIYRQTVGNDAHLVQEILNNPAAIRVTLNPQNNATGKVTFVMVPNSLKGVLIADGVPALSDDKQYQMWMTGDKGRESCGVFSINQSVAQVLITMPELPDQYQGLGITVEPRGGSPGPTSPPLYTGRYD